MITIARLEREMRRLVASALERGTPQRELERQIAALMTEHGIADALRDDLMRKARAEHTWINERTMDAAERRVVAEITTTSDTGFARIEDAINEKVARVVDRGLRSGMPSAQIEGLVARAVKGSRGNAETIVLTALGAFDRGATLIQADRAGVGLFKVAGTPPGAISHDWCRTNYGKQFTREQIKAMTNGTTLSVELHCGGWRCIHYWQAVV